MYSRKKLSLSAAQVLVYPMKLKAALRSIKNMGKIPLVWKRFQLKSMGISCAIKGHTMSRGIANSLASRALAISSTRAVLTATAPKMPANSAVRSLSKGQIQIKGSANTRNMAHKVSTIKARSAKFCLRLLTRSLHCHNPPSVWAWGLCCIQYDFQAYNKMVARANPSIRLRLLCVANLPRLFARMYTASMAGISTKPVSRPSRERPKNTPNAAAAPRPTVRGALG